MNNGSRTRGLRKRANIGASDGTTKEVIGKETLTTGSRTSNRKRSHPNSNTADSTNKSKPAKSPSKHASVKPSKTGKLKDDSTANNGSYMNGNGKGRHLTRSRNPDAPAEQIIGSKRNRQATSFYRPEECSEEEVEQPPIEVYATILASVDERSYQRALMQDADNISRRLLIPLALPWTHRTTPVVRNIPFDLDDLIEVTHADDGTFTPYENGPFGFGRFDTGQLRRGNPTLGLTNALDTVCSASRRADDMGVMEIRTISLPPNPIDDYDMSRAVAPSAGTIPNDSLRPIPRRQDFDPTIKLPPGEMALRLFEEAQKNKKRRRTQSKSCVQQRFISVRVNSSSSRSTILPPITANSSHLFLEAKLPAEVQNGKTLSISKARKIAEELGSFNLRDSLAKYDPSTNNAARTPVGRCQVMWSQKSPADQPQRGVYYSRLSGNKMDPGYQRRPTEIRVCLKVNGKIFTPGIDDSNTSDSENDNDIDLSQQLSETIDFAIDRSLYSTFDGSAPSKQCLLDSEKMMSNAIQALSKIEVQTKTNKGAKSTQTPIPSTAPSNRFPKIECVPSLDGLICTLCTSPGSINEKCVHEKLNNEARRGGKFCTVCWENSSSPSGTVNECSRCGLLVHPLCCLDKGDTESTTDGESTTELWKCAVCREDYDAKNEPTVKSKRKSRLPLWMQEGDVVLPAKIRQDDSPTTQSPYPACALCPYTGGAMSQCKSSDNITWVHEICRIWTQDTLFPDDSLASGKNFGSEICALCGASEHVSFNPSTKPEFSGKVSCLIKCSASRCNVYFHPMCALLSQRDRSFSENNIESRSGIEKAKAMDQKHCMQFILTKLRCEFIEGDNGKNPGIARTQKLQVGFCGIHNPNRERGFYGLYPGGLHTDNGALIVPSLA